LKQKLAGPFILKVSLPEVYFPLVFHLPLVLQLPEQLVPHLALVQPVFPRSELQLVALVVRRPVALPLAARVPSRLALALVYQLALLLEPDLSGFVYRPKLNHPLFN
jgi:hypothetical protein